MLIVIGNGLGNSGSNPRHSCLHNLVNVLGSGMNLSLLFLPISNE